MSYGSVPSTAPTTPAQSPTLDEGSGDLVLPIADAHATISVLTRELNRTRDEIRDLRAVMPAKAASAALQIELSRRAQHEAEGARDIMARSLAEHIARLRATETALAERDRALDKGKADSVTDAEALARVEQERDDALKELAQLRASTKHLEAMLVDGSETDESTTDDEESNQTKILRTFSRETYKSPSLAPTSPTQVHPMTGKATRNVEFKSEYPSTKVVQLERKQILAHFPEPKDMPNDPIRPFIIPTPFTIYEFFSNATGLTRVSLSGYRTFVEANTTWCTGREEHGYHYTPVFKCQSGRAVAAFKWTEADVKGSLSKPTECFFYKDGKWYYAGTYVGIRLRDITPDEYLELPAQTKEVIVTETLKERRNVTPANVLETTQLYELGALRVACVGLQCVGFNMRLYVAIHEQVKKCQDSGVWRGAHFG